MSKYKDRQKLIYWGKKKNPQNLTLKNGLSIRNVKNLITYQNLQI